MSQKISYDAKINNHLLSEWFLDIEEVEDKIQTAIENDLGDYNLEIYNRDE